MVRKDHDGMTMLPTVQGKHHARSPSDTLSYPNRQVLPRPEILPRPGLLSANRSTVGSKAENTVAATKKDPGCGLRPFRLAMLPPGFQPTAGRPATSTVEDYSDDQSRGQRCGNLNLPAKAKYPGLVFQPDSSPVSQEQLAAEVKGIYAGLMMVEAKCIDVDAVQASSSSQLGPEQWQALIALHTTLLHEHHDFLIATQHPSASPTLRDLTTKYTTPARIWRHGIHAFLEVLRRRQPESLEFELAFIYLAYQMIALLFEAVPPFIDTWIECLGDLARYRMAIEGETEAHAQWSAVAARWYTTASDQHPATGRLNQGRSSPRNPTRGHINHHPGNLERPVLWKSCYYAKALSCVTTFQRERDPLSTVCARIVPDKQAIQNSNRSDAEACIVTFHALASVSNTIQSYHVERDHRDSAGPSHSMLQSTWRRIPSLLSGILPHPRYSGVCKIAGALRILGLTRVVAADTGDSSVRYVVKDSLSFMGDLTFPIFPYAIMAAGILRLRHTLRTFESTAQEPVNTAVASAASAFGWWVLQLTVDGPSQSFAIAGCSWASAWVNLVASCCQCLQNQRMFVLVTVFGGGGLLAFLLTCLTALSTVDDGSLAQVAFDLVLKAGFLSLTAWTWIVFEIQRAWETRGERVQNCDAEDAELQLPVPVQHPGHMTRHRVRTRRHRFEEHRKEPGHQQLQLTWH